MSHLFTNEELKKITNSSESSPSNPHTVSHRPPPPPPPSHSNLSRASYRPPPSPFSSAPHSPSDSKPIQRGRFTVTRHDQLSVLSPFQPRTPVPVSSPFQPRTPVPVSSPFQPRTPVPVSTPFQSRTVYFEDKPSNLKTKGNMNLSPGWIPRIEFYEYDIENYTYGNSARFVNFKKRESSNVNEIGIIAEIENPPSKFPVSMFHLMESSIDPLVSTSTQVRDIPNVPNRLEILNYYKKYKNWKTKLPYTEIDENIKSFYTIPRKSKIQETVIEAFEKQREYVRQFVPDVLTIPSNSLNNQSFIYQIKLEPGERLVIFGDFHGSFHTFIRQLFRLYLLGVIDLTNYQIMDGYRIIFLGDLIDRGNYGIDIIYLICKMIIVNNTPEKLKCILNRGNHEERLQASHDGFARELSFKNIEESIKERIFRLFEVCSSAIVLNCEGNRYWCCHGGIPVEKYTERIFKIPSIKDGGDTNRNYVFYISDLNISKQIRWNDFRTDEFNYSPNRGDPHLFKVGTKSLDAFMKFNQIDFIIRGHQDSNYNSCILTSSQKLINNKTKTLSRFGLDIDSDWYNLSKIPLDPSLSIPNADADAVLFEKNPLVNEFLHKVPFTEIKENYRVNGAVARIDTFSGTFKNRSSMVKNINSDYKFYPVITISTNTDNGRHFTKDSFALLRLDGDDGTSLFTKEYIMASEYLLESVFTGGIKKNKSKLKTKSKSKTKRKKVKKTKKTYTKK